MCDGFQGAQSGGRIWDRSLDGERKQEDMSQLEFHEFGAKVRHVRKVKRLRLKDVAADAGCSESLLSKIECGKATPSLRMLHRIAAALDMSIASLFSDGDGKSAILYRSGERPTIVISNSQRRDAIVLERLTLHAEGRSLEGNLHVIAPGATNGGEIKHEGEEVGYVLEGEFELNVGGATYHLKPGDSFFFRSELPHSYRNSSNITTRVLWINTPPTF